ncbi:MAG: FkbM family methyltransferase [Bryobacteraceae bacterium]|nr:FkbM family methyltransferase [Bryobacteraceae bacterium]
MSRYSLQTFSWPSVRWKLRQKYSEFRSLIGGGRHVWEVEPGVRFVATSGDAFSHVLYVCGGHENTEMRWCTEWLTQDDSVIDCGANIGYFSAYLAQKCHLARIIAVEGNRRTAQTCAANLSLLGLGHVTVIEAILAENTKQALSIPDSAGREPWQSVVSIGEQTERAGTITTTLDMLVEKHRLAPALVKIDCEGFEPFILRGATRLLSEIRPAFMIECNDQALLAVNTRREELFSVLRNHDYQLFHLASFDGYRPFGIPCDESFPSQEFNFAAIPGDVRSLEKWRKATACLSQESSK